MTKKNPGVSVLSFRMPETLHAHVTKLASDDRRSLNSYIVGILERHTTATIPKASAKAKRPQKGKRK